MSIHSAIRRADENWPELIEEWKAEHKFNGGITALFYFLGHSEERGALYFAASLTVEQLLSENVLAEFEDWVHHVYDERGLEIVVFIGYPRETHEAWMMMPLRRYSYTHHNGYKQPPPPKTCH